MFLRQVPMNGKFLAGNVVYTRVGADKVEDENGVITTLSKTANVKAIPEDDIVEETPVEEAPIENVSVDADDIDDDEIYSGN